MKSLIYETVTNMKPSSSRKLAEMLNIHPARSLEALFKAQLISAIIAASKKKGISHAELARRSAVPRSAVTGILSGSLQKVTINRLLRLLEAVELRADIRIRDAA